MLLTGLNGFKLSRDTLYTFSLGINNLGGESTYQVYTNYNYFDVWISYIGFDMKISYVCQDCADGNLIYDNKFCVSQCPRGYSIYDRSGVKFCDLCSIEQLKVVDPSSGNCVCAARHYLDTVKNICQPCGYDCMTCSQADKCLTCDNSMLQTKRKLTNTGRCECPAVGYYDNKAAEDIVCQSCHTKCLTCNGPYIHDCLTCSGFKEVDSNGFCVCKNGYIEDASGNCVCAPPRTLNQNGICYDANTPCGANKIQQFIDLTRRCVCQTGYIAVLDDCIKCGTNSVFNKNTLTC